MASVTLASGTLAGVMPTARMRPVSKSWNTWRLYPIDTDTAALAAVPHLGVLHADPPLFGNPLDEASFAVLVHLHILRLDLLGNLERVRCQVFLLL